jgi:LPS-assembly protein
MENSTPTQKIFSGRNMPQHFATLLVVLAAASPALAQAPAPAQAAIAEEKGPTTIDAERIDGVGDLEFSAHGSAELRQGELTIFGDVLKYNQELGRVEADGGVRLQLGVDRFFGPRLVYDTLGDTGLFYEPRFLIQQEQVARGGAERIEFLGKGRYRMKDATFTTCAPGNDDWQLEARELVLDYQIAEGRAESPRLRFFDTTILAAPFATFPLERRRKSGILAPHFGNSSTRGFELGVPYYWNIAPQYDATITPVYMTKRGALLKNELRYLDRRYKGESRLEYMPSDDEAQRSRFGISLQHTHEFQPNLVGRLDYNRVSDDRYFVDLGTEVRQSSIGNLAQEGYVTYSGGLGPLSYSAQARIQKFQTLQDPLAPITPPYERVPQLNFSGYVNDIAGFLDTSLPGEYTRFIHPTLVQGIRGSANPTLAVPILSPGWFFTPRAGLRHVSYQLDNPVAGNADNPRASIPWFSADSGLMFEREARWFGEDLTQTLEPRLFYVYVPYRDQDQMPLFDTAIADFNFPQLFSENRFGGGDRFGDANQLTAAMTTRFLQPGGQETFRATIGQRYYFSDERVTLTPATGVRTRNSSDVLASIGGRLFRNLTFDATAQYNRRDERAERYSVAARYSPGPAKTLNASYRFNREALRQVDISAQWPISAGWFAVGRYNYSLLDRRLVDGLAGIEYNAGCWIFRAVYQRIQAAAQLASTTLFFQLEFNGIGQIGTTEVVSLLKRNVSGYSVSNPRDPALVPRESRPQLPFQMIY